MEFINLLNDPSLALISAKEVLTTGGVIIFPTDTVYGLCALPDNKAALEKIYSLKNNTIIFTHFVVINSIIGKILNSEKILIGASDGASDYGNKFGEPVISGFTRSFKLKIAG